MEREIILIIVRRELSLRSGGRGGPLLGHAGAIADLVAARLPPQSKRQPVVELPRLRLPLPERTGSDRDELLSPHGFVDRAYLVFLLRCVSLLRTNSLRLQTISVRPSPLGVACGPEAVAHSRAVLLRGVKEGTSPRARPRPSLLLPLPLR